MTIRRCVTYCNDLRETLTFDLKVNKNVMAQTRKYYLKKQLFDLEVKGKGPTKVIAVCDT
jgi:hypothetical protein